MKSPSCLRVCMPPSPHRLKAGIVELQETTFDMQRLSKHFPEEINTHETIDELFDAVFSMLSASYKILSI
jgi:hexokinase